MVGTDVFAAGECQVSGAGAVRIGTAVLFGEKVRIESARGRAVAIGDGAWIGDGASIRPGVSVGRGALVCSGSVVDADVPDYAVVEGAPAQVTWRLR